MIYYKKERLVAPFFMARWAEKIKTKSKTFFNYKDYFIFVRKDRSRICVQKQNPKKQSQRKLL